MAVPDPSVDPAQRVGARPSRGGSDPNRTDWLAFATDGPVVDACRLAGEGHGIVTSSAELFAALAATRPRLVIVAAPPAGLEDIAMIAAVRHRRPSLRALLVDRPGAIDERLSALELGFDEALADSISPTELAARARLLVRRSRASFGRIVEVAEGTELDLAAHELRRDGASVHLRPKEFSLLALLATNPGRAFNRRQLLDRVWGIGHAGDPRTVDVHVRWLRSKLEADPDRPVRLVTVRGTGYRLDLPDR